MEFTLMYRSIIPACGLAACLAVPFDASAAVINTSAESRIDKTQTGTATLSGGSLAFGTGTNVEFRTLFEFDIASSSSDIASADTIELVFQIKGDINEGDIVDIIEIYNLDAGAADGSATAGDFAAAGSLVTTLASSSIADEDVVTIDVTSFIKADLLAGQTYSSFRLEGDDPVFDNGNHYFQAYKTSEAVGGIQAPVLNVTVPEPGSLALAGLGGLTLLGRRRSKIS